METKLNIANILKDKPTGTKLYADAFGELKLECIKVTEEDIIYTRSKIFTFYPFYSDGKYSKDGEPILVPSKKMRDWNKFAWKQGDILVSDDGKSQVVFSRWYDDNYTSFYGKYYLNNENKDKAFYYKTLVCTTKTYSLEDKDAAKTYINAIEEKLGGKLNLETLKIEKTQLEFKNGDILRNSTDNSIFIFKNYNGNKDLTHYAGIANSRVILSSSNIPWCSKNENVRYATEEEKQQLFEALAKEGKAWDAEKKVIVDLKPKWTPKPFDRVITRTPDTPWTANFFSHIDSDGVKNCIDDRYLMCLPYNEETAKLIGTTDNWEGNNN